MGDRVAKESLYDGFAEVAKALGNGRRAEIVDLLAQGERHVEEIAAAIDQSIANTSFHLRALASVGLVTTRRDGTRIYYRLASDQVGELWAALRQVAVAHHDVLDALADAYLGDRDGLDMVRRDELARRLRDGDLIIIDVRPEGEYGAGHIAGAVSIPIDRLARQLRSLPADVDVVAYCRGPYCVFADDAVRLLRRRGRRARRLEDGFPEWRRAGLPIATVTDDQATPRATTALSRSTGGAMR
jgi:DNA-binding transcriptional ArsR family regulator/rhodanese-related sulfurtransferase